MKITKFLFIKKLIGKNFLFEKILLTVFKRPKHSFRPFERMAFLLDLLDFEVSSAQPLYGTKMEFYIL